MKLDPVAEFFFYDFVYRNRSLFRRAPNSSRHILGFEIVNGEPIPILRSYADFKKAVTKFRHTYAQYVYFDVAAYFTHIYHHDLIRWCEDVGADKDSVEVFGKFLRETSGGRSINCLPQGIYPSKMVGASFLRFLEDSSGLRCSQSVRLMDDVWLFDDRRETLVGDFLIAQSLLSDRGLCVNEEKSAILQGHDLDADLPADLDEIKIRLLQRRREALADASEYSDASEEESAELKELTEEEQQYLLSLLKRENIQEEDAELVLTLMRDHSADVMEFIPSLLSEFPRIGQAALLFLPLCR